MSNSSYQWGQKKHDRTFLSTSFYWLSKTAFYLAPKSVTRLMREQGFSVKPFKLSAEQDALHQQAHRFELNFKHNKIKVYEWGTGPVILLVHGWAGRGLQLNAFIKPLLSHGFKVVAFDQKGHGESSSRFSSFPEIVRSTNLVAAHYGSELIGVVAHSIGSNSIFKVSENIDRKLKLVIVAPMENFLGWLEKMRMKIGIDENLFAQVVQQIEAESELRLSDLTVHDYEKISRHDVLLVHDKFDRMNKINASYDLLKNLSRASLMQTERLGHSRILENQDVVDRAVAHLIQP